MLDQLREAIEYVSQHPGLVITGKFVDCQEICYGIITGISEYVDTYKTPRTEKFTTINVVDSWTKLNRVFSPYQMKDFNVVND